MNKYRVREIGTLSENLDIVHADLFDVKGDYVIFFTNEEDTGYPRLSHILRLKSGTMIEKIK